MGISISNATSSAITKYSESLRSGEPDWSMIPSAGKSNKSQAEFVSEIKESVEVVIAGYQKKNIELLFESFRPVVNECDDMGLGEQVILSDKKIEEISML